MKIEVAYVGPEGQWLVALELPEGATALEAIDASGLREKLSRDRFEPPRLGIFSTPVEPSRVLRENDRVELYRPLEVDPKDARRARVEKKKASNKTGR